MKAGMRRRIGMTGEFLPVAGSEDVRKRRNARIALLSTTLRLGEASANERFTGTIPWRLLAANVSVFPCAADAWAA
ncbi:MAG TPA: hypothetical protein VHF86_11200 [Xanthomonadaceae bacterium]|nr:hypothetical protein [Xanthomonadaceae bacterium]